MRGACGGFKLLGPGGSLDVPTVVKSISLNEGNLTVSNTDGSTYNLELPKLAPVNMDTVNLLNASGLELVAELAALT